MLEYLHWVPPHLVCAHPFVSSQTLTTLLRSVRMKSRCHQITRTKGSSTGAEWHLARWTSGTWH